MSILRSLERNAWQGAYLRGQQKSPCRFLVNMGGGRVAFIRESDFLEPATARERVHLRTERKLLPLNTLLSPYAPAYLRDHLLNDSWTVAEIEEANLNPAVAKEADQPVVLTAINIEDRLNPKLLIKTEK